MHTLDATTTDPVCGMPVDNGSAITVDYLGVTYQFCGDACAETFQRDSARWARESGDRAVVHDPHDHEVQRA